MIRGGFHLSIMFNVLCVTEWRKLLVVHLRPAYTLENFVDLLLSYGYITSLDLFMFWSFLESTFVSRARKGLWRVTRCSCGFTRSHIRCIPDLSSPVNRDYVKKMYVHICSYSYGKDKTSLISGVEWIENLLNFMVPIVWSEASVSSPLFWVYYFETVILYLLT